MIFSTYAVPGIIAPQYNQNVSKETLKNFIINTCLQHYEVALDQVKSKTRKRSVVECRQTICYLLRNNTSMSLKEIGELFPCPIRPHGLDHTTVIHACNTIRDIMETDHQFNTQITRLQMQVSRFKKS